MISVSREGKVKKAILIHGYNGIPQIYFYLKRELGKDGYEVIMPTFPTQKDITLAAYFAVLDQYRADFSEETVVIAHSVGNIMLVKYLCEHDLRVGCYISLAGFGEPFEVEGKDDLNAVIKPLRLSGAEKKKIQQLAAKRYAIYSDNDHIVPFATLRRYAKDIMAETWYIPEIGHMGKKSGLTELPEVLEAIERLKDK